MKMEIIARDYLFDYIYLTALAFPDGDIWTETMVPLNTAERVELMLGVSSPPHITYYGVVGKMSIKNMFEDYNWYLVDEEEALDIEGGI